MLGTQTRNAWLGFLVACTILLVMRHRVFLLALPIVCVVLFLLSPPAVQDRILSFGNLRDTTVQQRLSMWRSGLQITRDHPWTGVGMGVMRDMEHRYRPSGAPFNPSDRWGHLHNNIVQVAAERGLIGLAMWLAIWATFLWQVWRVYRQPALPDGRDRALVTGSLACVIGFLAAGMFEYNYGDSDIVSMLYFIMALPFLVRTPEPTDS